MLEAEMQVQMKCAGEGREKKQGDIDGRVAQLLTEKEVRSSTRTSCGCKIARRRISPKLKIWCR